MKMDFHTILYASMLSGLTVLQGCKAGIPEVRNPETRPLFEGVYTGQIEGRSARYTVEKEMCMLITDQKVSFPYGWEMRTITIRDTDCDNSADTASDNYGIIKGREYFLGQGTAEVLDSLLEQGQGLVKKENRIKEE